MIGQDRPEEVYEQVRVSKIPNAPMWTAAPGGQAAETAGGGGPTWESQELSSPLLN